MDFTDLVLVGLVRDLPDTSEDLVAADALAYQVRESADISAIAEYTGSLPVIATNCVPGLDSDSVGEQAQGALREAARTEPVDAVEIDYERLTSDSSVIDPFRDASVDVIVTYRNYAETPPVEALLSVVDTANRSADAVYIETMAQSPDDTLTLLATLSEATDYGVTVGGACMGEVGRHTRVVAPVYGSKLAYAPLDLGSDIGTPGQFALAELATLIKEADDPSPAASLHPRLRNHDQLTDRSAEGER